LQKYFVINLEGIENTEIIDDKRRLKRRLTKFKLIQELVEKDLQVLKDAVKTNRTR
jgi:hypothetical protein